MAFGDSLSLLFKINADSSGAKRELSNFRGDVAKEIAGITNEGNKLSSVIRTATGVAVGIGAIAGAAIGTGAAVFNLAKQTADLGSELFDASQKTGVGAEALSALKFAADQSGSSLGEVSKAVTLFSRTVAEAARGSDEAKDKLRRLGIDPQEAINDLQGALAKAFKTINDAPDGIKQTAAATDAFGRSGANIIPTIKSFDGDLAALIKRAKELGVVFTDEDVRAADAFGDTLDTLRAQTRGVANEFALGFMPVITKGMADMSISLQANREAWRGWGKETGEAISGILNDLRHYKMLMDDIFGTGPGGFHFLPYTVPAPPRYAPGEGVPGVPGTRAMDYLGIKPPRGTAPDPYSVDVSTSQDKEKAAAAKKLQDEAAKMAKKASDVRLEIIRYEREEAKRIYDKVVEDEKSTTEQRLAARDAYTKTLSDLLEREKKEIKTQEDFKAAQVQREKELTAESTRLLEESEKEKREIRQRAADKELRDLISKHNRAEEIAEIYDEIALKQREYAAEREQITYEEAERAIAAIQAQAFLRRKEALEEELKATKEGSEERAEIQHRIDILEAQAAAFKEEAERRKRDAIQKTIDKERERLQQTFPGLGESVQKGAEGLGITGDVGGGMIGIAAQAAEIASKPPDLSGWGAAFTQLKEIGMNAFGALAQGMGQLVQNWIMLGKQSNVSVAQMVKSVVAGVAAMAATQAVYELALGIAALTPWGAAIYGPAVMHFKAAALLGSIALGAAVVGRALPGGGESGSQSGSFGGSAVNSLNQPQNQPQAIDVGRTRGERSVLEIHIRSNDSHIVEAVTRNYQQNGAVRQIVINDGTKVAA